MQIFKELVMVLADEHMISWDDKSSTKDKQHEPPLRYEAFI